jgi:hypothetical protein
LSLPSRADAGGAGDTGAACAATDVSTANRRLDNGGGHGVTWWLSGEGVVCVVWGSLVVVVVPVHVNDVI